MPTNIPTSGVRLRPEKDRVVKVPDQAPQSDRLHPDMPSIPGVANNPPPAAVSLKTIPLIILLSVVAIAGAIAWRLLPVRGTKASPDSGTGGDSAVQSAPAPSQAAPTVAQPSAGPTAAAILDEISAPWSSKTFTFVNPTTQEVVPAMIIRLPGGAASRSSSYWAFSLNAPYQTCELEFVTSISQIATKYGFRASHPMVISPCDSTVYDPLQVSSVPSGAWVRGQVVQGGGIRPPIAIEVRVEGRSVIADRME